MANVSIREAVKFYQVSRPTLSKALKSGDVSGVKDGKGQWQIDPAELARVYQPRKIKAGQDGQILPENLTTKNTSKNQREAAALEREIDLLREMLTKAEANSEHWRLMAERQQTLLENKRPKSILKRIIGR